jgi:hypothetical protein
MSAIAICRQSPQLLGLLNRKRAAKLGWRGRRNCRRMTATPTTMGNTTNTLPMKIAPRTVGTRGRKRIPDHIPIPTKQTPTTKETGSKYAGLSTTALPRAYSRKYATHNPPANAERMMDATRCPRYEDRLASPTVTKNKMRMIDLILSPSDSIMRQSRLIVVSRRFHSLRGFVCRRRRKRFQLAHTAVRGNAITEGHR